MNKQIFKALVLSLAFTSYGYAEECGNACNKNYYLQVDSGFVGCEGGYIKSGNMCVPCSNEYTLEMPDEITRIILERWVRKYYDNIPKWLL